MANKATEQTSIFFVETPDGLDEAVLTIHYAHGQNETIRNCRTSVCVT